MAAPVDRVGGGGPGLRQPVRLLHPRGSPVLPPCTERRVHCCSAQPGSAFGLRPPHPEHRYRWHRSAWQPGHHSSSASFTALLSCRLPDCSVGSALPALLVEQASLKQSELDAHPVRSNMKLLLRSLDQLSPFEPDGGLARPDYVRSFLDYVNTLASVVVRSLASEGKNSTFLLDLNVTDYLSFIFLVGS